jgi:hypothetical protein
VILPSHGHPISCLAPAAASAAIPRLAQLEFGHRHRIVPLLAVLLQRMLLAVVDLHTIDLLERPDFALLAANRRRADAAMPAVDWRVD